MKIINFFNEDKVLLGCKKNLENIKIIELEITFIKKYLIYTVNVNFISPQNLFNKHFSI